MAIQLPGAFYPTFRSSVQPLARAWLIESQALDPAIIGEAVKWRVTDWSHQVSLPWLEPNVKFLPGAQGGHTRRRADFGEGSSSVTIQLSNTGIEYADLKKRVLDNARVTEVIFNPYEPRLGALLTNEWFVGFVDFNSIRAEIDLVSLTSKLTNRSGALLTVDCSNEFGDEVCGSTNPNYVSKIEWVKVNGPEDPSRLRFRAQTTVAPPHLLHTDAWKGAQVWIKTGNSQGLKARIASCTAANFLSGVIYEVDFVLSLPLHDPLATGTTLDMMMACDHARTSCEGWFENLNSFRGCPNIVGTDGLMKSPDAY